MTKYTHGAYGRHPAIPKPEPEIKYIKPIETPKKISWYKKLLHKMFHKT